MNVLKKYGIIVAVLGFGIVANSCAGEVRRHLQILKDANLKHYDKHVLNPELLREIVTAALFFEKRSGGHGTYESSYRPLIVNNVGLNIDKIKDVDIDDFIRKIGILQRGVEDLNNRHRENDQAIEAAQELVNDPEFQSMFSASFDVQTWFARQRAEEERYRAEVAQLRAERRRVREEANAEIVAERKRVEEEAMRIHAESRQTEANLQLRDQQLENLRAQLAMTQRELHTAAVENEKLKQSSEQKSIRGKAREVSEGRRRGFFHASEGLGSSSSTAPKVELNESIPSEAQINAMNYAELQKVQKELQKMENKTDVIKKAIGLIQKKLKDLNK